MSRSGEKHVSRQHSAETPSVRGRTIFSGSLACAARASSAPISYDQNGRPRRTRCWPLTPQRVPSWSVCTARIPLGLFCIISDRLPPRPTYTNRAGHPNCNRRSHRRRRWKGNIRRCDESRKFALLCGRASFNVWRFVLLTAFARARHPPVSRASSF